jgi:hypothetical protein
MAKKTKKTITRETALGKAWLTPAEVAAVTGLNLQTINRLLQADANNAADKKHFPNAFYVGEGRNRRWQVPREAALAYKRRKSGPKPSLATIERRIAELEALRREIAE